MSHRSTNVVKNTTIIERDDVNARGHGYAAPMPVGYTCRNDMRLENELMVPENDLRFEVGMDA